MFHVKYHNVSEEAQAAINLFQLSQDKQQKSTTSCDRKDRLQDSLFEQRTETIARLNLYRGILSSFLVYVKRFQTESPQVHTLFDQMLNIRKEILATFMKLENIPVSIKKLVTFDVTDRKLQKPDRELCVGRFTYADMNKARVDKFQQHWVSKLYADLCRGYVMAGKKLLNQLPLKNKTLR